MNNINCKICNSHVKEIFKISILKKYLVSYYQCSNCKYLCTEEPFWLKEAYDDSINISDTGLLERNIKFTKITSEILYLLNRENDTFLDFGGGYGVFVRLMRDIGYDFYWQDDYTKNIFARGFEFDNKKALGAITAFEVFEHFINPREEIDSLLKLSDTLIFSTVLYDDSVNLKDWWYLAPYSGQHISFYTRQTLEFIAKEYKLEYMPYKDLHVLSKQKFCHKKLTLLNLTYKVRRFSNRFSNVKIHNLNSRTLEDSEKFINYTP